MVFISTAAGEENVRRAVKTGALAFVRRASTAEDLLLAARAALRKQRFFSDEPEEPAGPKLDLMNHANFGNPVINALLWHGSFAKATSMSNSLAGGPTTLQLQWKLGL